MRSPAPKGIVAPLLLAAVAWTAGARAQNSALAENLFREGKQLLGERRFDEACPKFKESARLDLSSGVELALGICLEGQGRIASAWGAYLSAATLAHHDGRVDREEAAKGRAKALEPRLSHATIDVAQPTAALPGLVVRQDDVVLESPAWFNAPVDPGTHRIDVTAPGKKPFSRTYLVAADGDSISVSVPVLEDAPPPAPAPAPAAVLRTPGDQGGAASGAWRRPTGFVSGGIGVAALAAGSVLGAITLSDAAAIHRVCPMSPCPNTGTRFENQTAETLADASTTLFIVAGVTLAAGAILVLTSPHSTEAPRHGAWIRPVLTPTFGGFVGRW